MPLDKWEEPLEQLLVYSLSEELFRETAGLFWVAGAVACISDFTLIGLSSIPEATRLSMRPPRISIAPAGSKSAIKKRLQAKNRFDAVAYYIFYDGHQSKGGNGM